MLVLTRKPKQSIMLGDTIEITVLAVAGDKVRLGISAPRSVAVFRSEVYEEIVRERAGDAPQQIEVEAELNHLTTPH